MEIWVSIVWNASSVAGQKSRQDFWHKKEGKLILNFDAFLWLEIQVGFLEQKEGKLHFEV